MGKGSLERALIVLVCAATMSALILAGCSAGAASSSGSDSATSESNAAATASASSTDNGAAGAGDEQPPIHAECAITRDADDGGICLDIAVDDFNELGFAYGDSVDIAFSNGYELHGIPYHNGYYVRVGDLVLVGYSGDPAVKATTNEGDALWDTAGLSEGDTATVTRSQANAFRDVQEAFDFAYANERSDYDSDVQHANFRPLSGGSVRQGAVYRSASPIDNENGRAADAQKLMERAGIAYVLDLSDDDDEVNAHLAEDAAEGIDVSYSARLRDDGLMSKLNLSTNYLPQSFAETLASGLAEMSQHDGPYLVHCLEGKDRTGFVCVLLEALCGATYDEMAVDYMATFENYFEITKEKEPDKYATIVHLNLDGMLSFLAGTDDEANLTSLDYAPFARSYLKAGGMTDAQIDELIARIAASAS